MKKSLSPRDHSIGLSLISSLFLRAGPGTADHAHVTGHCTQHTRFAVGTGVEQWRSLPIDNLSGRFSHSTDRGTRHLSNDPCAPAPADLGHFVMASVDGSSRTAAGSVSRCLRWLRDGTEGARRLAWGLSWLLCSSRSGVSSFSATPNSR